MDDGLLHHARKLARTLAPGDLEETLSRITTAAVEVLPGVAMASMTIRHSDNRLQTVAPTHDVLYEVDAKQLSSSSVLATNPSPRRATPLLRPSRPTRVGPSTPIRRRWKRDPGACRDRLFDAQRFHGALNLYSGRVGAFEDLGPLAHCSPTRPPLPSATPRRSPICTRPSPPISRSGRRSAW